MDETRNRPFRTMIALAAVLTVSQIMMAISVGAGWGSPASHTASHSLSSYSYSGSHDSASTEAPDEPTQADSSQSSGYQYTNQQSRLSEETRVWISDHPQVGAFISSCTSYINSSVSANEVRNDYPGISVLAAGDGLAFSYVNGNGYAEQGLSCMANLIGGDQTMFSHYLSYLANSHPSYGDDGEVIRNTDPYRVGDYYVYCMTDTRAVGLNNCILDYSTQTIPALTESDLTPKSGW